MRSGNIFLEGLFKGFGHFFLILNHVLFIPSLTVFAEVSRCTKNASSKSTSEFICLETIQLELIVFSAFGCLACIVLVAYTNLFLNSQFPNRKIPFATWSTKHKLIHSLWKVLYVYHYDLLGSTSYDVFLRVAALLVLVY